MIIIFMFTTIFVGLVLASYFAHVMMNITNECPHGFATFSRFLTEWQIKRYEPNLEIKRNYAAIYEGNSISEYNSNKLYIWAGIIRFDKKCMILDPISWIMFCVWKHFNLKDSTKKYKGIPRWNKL